MMLVEKWPFFQIFFLGNMGQQNVFYDIPKQKSSFLGYKKRRSNSRKIDIFPKGLTHGFSRKIAIFPNFFFRQYGPAKCILRYSKTKKLFFRL